MTPEEVIRRTETNSTLFMATTEDLVEARKIATREIHRYELDKEIKNRNKKQKPITVSGITHVPRKNRCPTKKDLR